MPVVPVQVEPIPEDSVKERASGYVGVASSSRMIFDIDDHATRLGDNAQFRKKLALMSLFDGHCGLGVCFNVLSELAVRILLVTDDPDLRSWCRICA